MKALVLLIAVACAPSLSAQESPGIDFKFSGKAEIDATSVANYRSTIRRLRLTMKSDFGVEDISFKSTLDFKSEGFKDIYFEWFDLFEAGTLRVGHFREPFSFEAMTSGDNILFMERSMTTEFSPGRNVGAMLYQFNPEEKHSWALGAFLGTSSPNFDFTNGGDNAFGMTGRFHWHTVDLNSSAGLAASLRLPKNNLYSFDIGGEVSSSSALLSTGDVIADSFYQLSAEAVTIRGPVTALVEAMLIGDQGGGEPHQFASASAQLGLVLWGDNHAIEPGRVSYQPIEGNSYEASLRSSWADLNSGNILGGFGSVHSLGLTGRKSRDYFWRAELNRQSVDGGDDIDILQFRFHFGF